ncbi:tail fiber protein [Pectobacterium aroidearum]|uniref:tail fiber protein n=1 Tax=Pectobacterium aroidearum TaxID=1201031 RepID=UPI002FC5BA14
MDQKFFRVPFAQSGDRQTIPEATPSDGSISFPSGWGSDYAKDPEVDANAKFVAREAMNAILYAITNAVRQYQVFGFPEYITPADNNGGAFSYSSGAVIRYRVAADQLFRSYVSIADNNTSVPGTDETKWQEFIYREATEQEAIDGESNNTLITPRRLHDGASYLDEQLKTALTPYLLPVGAIVMWSASTPPAGWLELNGQEFDTAENPKLAVMFPNGRVPDWRGRFVRAWSNGSTVDAGRELGSFQDDAIRNITGEFKTLDSFDYSSTGAFQQIDKSGPARIGGNPEAWNHTIIEFDASLVVPTADENRPQNVAAMYIIKTDLAESENSESTTPTALIISPQTVTINAGTTRQFIGTILPTDLAAGYPVAWSVSDSSLGSIDSSGLYTAISGRSGAQTIIASLSTGLTSTATVTQRIYLTSIVIGSAPSSLIAGNSYTVPVTYSPDGYTEVVNSASSDASVATLSIDGTLTISSGGTATLTLTGASSGVTDSITITATEEVLPEVYLQIDEHLSEIATAGAIAQAAARSNLGLGGLATKDGLTAADVGAVPQASASLGTENLNTVISPGRKFQSLTSNATLARNYPVALAGMLDVIRTTDAGIRQTFYPYNTTEVYHRYCVDTAANPIVFSAWAASGGDFLAKSQNLADVPDKPAARDNIGVGYTISTSEPPASAAGYAAGHIWYQV